MPKLPHKLLLGSALIALASLAHAQAAGNTGVAPSPTPGATTSPSTGATTTVVPNPANSAATDPYVQRREARKQAKEEYKARKKAAKQEYKTAKQAADANLKASGATTGVQPGAGDLESGGSGQ